MAFETLHSLFTALLLGRWPDWPEHTMVAAGEELRELVRDTAPQAALDDDEELERIKQTLVDFGALEESDTTTGLADLIEVLLPPADQP